MGGGISNLLKGFDNGVKQLIYEIDPSILKLKNISFDLIDNFQIKLNSNVNEYILSLRENLFICLFIVILFVLIIFVLMYNLNIILDNLRINILTRQYINLFVLTIIICCIFICLIYSNDINWIIFKIILFSLSFVFIILLIFIWFRFFLIYKNRIQINKYIWI